MLEAILDDLNTWDLLTTIYKYRKNFVEEGIIQAFERDRSNPFEDI